ncbi:MAG TPA: hypothetical protein VGB85_25165 [Nannocystis sp.]
MTTITAGGPVSSSVRVCLYHAAVLALSLVCTLLAAPPEAPDPFDPAASRPLSPSEQARQERRAINLRIEARAQQLATRQGWGVKEEWDDFGDGRFFDHAVTDSANNLSSGRVMLGIGGALSALGVGLLIAGGLDGGVDGLPLMIGGGLALVPGVSLTLPGAIRVGIHRGRLDDLYRIEREERRAGATARLRFRGLAPLYVPALGTGGLTLRLAF